MSFWKIAALVVLILETLAIGGLGIITLLTVRRWLFWLIQVVSVHLTIIGIPVCGVLALCKLSSLGPLLPSGEQLWHWPRWAWIWDNQEDGVDPLWYRDAHPTWPESWREFTWAALRNPCNNLRYVRGVSLKGRPYWRRTWGPKPGGHYAHAGWNSSGFPVLSAGRNPNPF